MTTVIYCPCCRQSLAQGETICPQCGYDQPDAAWRIGEAAKLRLLGVVLGLLWVPAVYIAFSAASYAVWFAAAALFDSMETALTLALIAGTGAGLLVIVFGISLICSVFRNAEAAARAAEIDAQSRPPTMTRLDG